MGNRCSIQQSEESNCWLEQSPENRLYRPFRYFWATLYNIIIQIILCTDVYDWTMTLFVAPTESWKIVNCTLCMTFVLSKNGVNFHSICHRDHSLGSDLSDHFFWSEYRVNRTRVHSLSSEFSLYTGVRIEWNSLLNEWNFFHSI